ncbi:T-cell surface glycoprotein CD4-like isoform 1-T2 [Discoglossus pictus]
MGYNLIICLLCSYIGLSLESGEYPQIIGEHGKSVILPCNLATGGDFTWNKDKVLVLNSRNQKRFYGTTYSSELCQIRSQQGGISLELKKIRFSDAGLFKCFTAVGSESVQLNVLKVTTSAEILFPSDSLTLNIESSPKDIPGLKVWVEKPSGSKEEVKVGNPLNVAKVNVGHSGTYKYHVTLNSNEATFTKDILVAGFYSTPNVLYLSGGSPVYISWKFNFDVLRPWLTTGIQVIKGQVSYSAEGANSSLLSTLQHTGGAVCWPESCVDKPSQLDNLGITIKKPKSGWYRMELEVKLAERGWRFQRDVCLGNLTVNALPSHRILLDTSNINLHCAVNCDNPNGTLQWKHGDKEVGPGGRGSLVLKISAEKNNLGVWTCSLTVGEKIVITANLTLEESIAFGVGSSLFLWVTVGGGVILLLICMLTIVLLTAQCRRKRRARLRAWLIQSLHENKTCECGSGSYMSG